MSEQPTFLTQQRWTIIFALVLALGPLTALTLGSKYADEETIARAEAGDRNYDAPGPFASFELAETGGAAADSTVLDITQDAALFSTFEQAIEQAGMLDVLKEDGPFTLFVPTNSAFNALSEDQRQALMQDRQALINLVSNHVVRARLGITDLLQADRTETLSGKRLELDAPGAQLSVAGAEIVQSNLVAGNGVVHVINRVIL
ncbi:fasciclin domain-containing protein [Halochromatium sp.]